MSQLLNALIIERRSQVLGYKAYLKKIVELTKRIKNTEHGSSERPKSLDTPAKRALYDNLNNDENLALKVDKAVRSSKQDDWEHNTFKTKGVRFAIKDVLHDDQLTERILDLVKNQQEYK
jgi:type I restriction enzyme R subunit